MMSEYQSIKPSRKSFSRQRRYLQCNCTDVYHTSTAEIPPPTETRRKSTLKSYPDVDTIPCCNLDYDAPNSVINSLKSKLDNLEPRVTAVGEKLQRIRDDMQNFRDVMTARRRDIDDLEHQVNERIAKANEKLQDQARELTDHKTSLSQDYGSLKQTMENVVSEMDCLKTWLIDNLRQINANLDQRDKELEAFQFDVLEQLKDLQNQIRASEAFSFNVSEQLKALQSQVHSRNGDVQDLRQQVDAKFSAVKDVLRKMPRRPLVVEKMSCSEEPEPVKDTTITIIQPMDPPRERFKLPVRCNLVIGGSEFNSDEKVEKIVKNIMKDIESIAPVAKTKGKSGRSFVERQPERVCVSESEDSGLVVGAMLSDLMHNANGILDRMKKDSQKT